jgi:hypothetical protein
MGALSVNGSFVGFVPMVNLVQTTGGLCTWCLHAWLFAPSVLCRCVHWNIEWVNGPKFITLEVHLGVVSETWMPPLWFQGVESVTTVRWIAYHLRLPAWPPQPFPLNSSLSCLAPDSIQFNSIFHLSACRPMSHYVHIHITYENN